MLCWVHLGVHTPLECHSNSNSNSIPHKRRSQPSFDAGYDPQLALALVRYNSNGNSNAYSNEMTNMHKRGIPQLVGSITV